MAQVKDGDTIKVHYTGKLDDGSVFDSSTDHEPLEFKLGENQIIRGFENAVIGMAPGEKSTVTIPAEEAFGPRRDEMVIEMNKEDFPADIDPEVGQKFNLQQNDDQTIIVTMTEITENTVTLDANHALAGKNLTFDIELVEIVET